MSVNAEAFRALRETARAVEHIVPSDVVTYHLHVEKEKNKNWLSRLFLKFEHNDLGTLELRSFRPPTLLLAQRGQVQPRTNQVDVVAIERSVLFSVLSTDVFAKAEVKCSPELQDFSPREAVRKLLALSLFGSDPRQRAAVIQLMNRPPLFLGSGVVCKAIFSYIPIEQANAYEQAAQQLVYSVEQETLSSMFEASDDLRLAIRRYQSHPALSVEEWNAFFERIVDSLWGASLSQEENLIIADLFVFGGRYEGVNFVLQQLPNAPAASLHRWITYLQQHLSGVEDST